MKRWLLRQYHGWRLRRYCRSQQRRLEADLRIVRALGWGCYDEEETE